MHEGERRIYLTSVQTSNEHYLYILSVMCHRVSEWELCVF